MVRSRGQRGSTLILFLGVIVTLAVLAGALVTVMANAQHNTLRERTQAKSFHVAEAAVDAAMANISPRWPSGPDATEVSFPTAAFQAEFAPTAGETPEYPGPARADVPAVSVWYFDNYDTNGDGFIDEHDSQVDGDPNNPQNPPDDKMYIVAQAGVLDRSSRVRVLVQRTYFEPQVPSTNVLWCGGSLKNSGGGGGVMPKVTIENPNPLGGDQVAVDVLEDVDNYPEIIDTGIDVQYGASLDPAHDDPKPLEKAFPEGARDEIVKAAIAAGRYFDSKNASPGKTPLETAMASPASAYGGPGLAGLTVVRQTTQPIQTYDFTGNSVLNSESQPGFLMLLGGINFKIGGTASFYGLLFVDGTVEVSKGTPSIHGALFATGDVDFRGTCNLKFNYMALTGGLSSRSLPATVAMVPNTWRELRPQ
jgi:hypothetical protein